MYHSVGNDGSFLTVKEEVFEKQLELIQRNQYVVVSLSTFLKERRPGSVVLTFDDAYENFYSLVWPLLKKYRIPATVFVPTALIGKTWKLSDGTTLPLMTAEMIREIAEAPEGLVEFMPHTENHADLSLLPSDKFTEELQKSRTTLKELLGGPHDILAYPYGRSRPEVVEYLKSNGWKAAVGTSFGLVSEHSDIFNLPRNRVGPETTPAQFLHFLCDNESMNEVQNLNANSNVNPKKKRVLVIMPDRFEKSAGGMGAHSKVVFEALSDKYEFYVAAYPLAGTQVPAFVTDYRQVGAPFTEVKFGALNVMIAQTEYLAAAMSFPKPDLVYAYDWSIYLAAIEAANLFNVPLVTRMCLSAILLSHQGYFFGLDIREPLHKALHNSFCEMEIRGLKRADRIVQISEGYAAMYDKVAPFRSKTSIVYNGIDLNEWQDRAGQQKSEPYSLPGKNKYKMVFIGRLVDMKGVLQLCKAKVPEGIDLIFIGDIDRADITFREALAQKMKHESNIFCLGALYGQEKIRALKSADAVIIPSYHEAFGNVGLEALAAGCIVLSSRVGGMADFLTDETSIFCGTKIETIEEAFKKFLELSESETDRARMLDAGQKMVQKFTIQSAALALDKVFTEVLSTHLRR